MLKSKFCLSSLLQIKTPNSELELGVLHFIKTFLSEACSKLGFKIILQFAHDFINLRIGQCF